MPLLSVLSSRQLAGIGIKAPTPLSQYLSLTFNQETYNEGDPVILTLSTANIPNGTTVGYTITGISQNDIVTGFPGGITSPSFPTGFITINNNTGTIPNLILDLDVLTEGTETILITLSAVDSLGNPTGGLIAAAGIIDTSNDPTATFWLDDNDNSATVRSIIGQTSMQINGVFASNPTVPRTIQGRTSGTQTTITSITANTGTFIEVDDTGNSTNFIVGEQLNLLAINYTITPAASNVNEGSSLTFTVTTTNLPNGYTLYWTVSPTSDFATTSGSFTVSGNSGTFTVTPTADVLSEGAETFTASVRIGSISGTIVATSSAVTINDTSVPSFILDSSFTTGTGFSANDARDVGFQTDNKIIAGGYFTSYNGTAANRIVRLNTNGTIDTTFNSGGAGFNTDAVLSLAVQSDNKIVVGGGFTSYNGATATRITRLNADGTLDTAFNSNTGGGVSSFVYGVALQSDGKIVLGGWFTTGGGFVANRIYRMNSNGTRDSTFVTGTGFNGFVYAVAVQADDKTLVGGTYTSYNGTTQNRFARLNTNGSLDTTFNSGGAGFNDGVFGIAVQTDGKILVGGSFSTYNGVTRNCLARLNADGTLDTSFANPFLNGQVQAIAVQPDGKILVGGTFSSAGSGGVISQRIARFNSDGTLDTSFITGSGFNGFLNIIGIQPDGKILTVGSYTTYQGTAQNAISRLVGVPLATPRVSGGLMTYDFQGTPGATTTTQTSGTLSTTITLTNSSISSARAPLSGTTSLLINGSSVNANARAEVGGLTITPTNFTWEGWVYYNSFAPGAGQPSPVLFSVGNDSANLLAVRWIDTNTVEFRTNISNASIAQGGSRPASTSPVIGAWQHHAITADGTNYKYYLDGTLIAQTTANEGTWGYLASAGRQINSYAIGNWLGAPFSLTWSNAHFWNCRLSPSVVYTTNFTVSKTGMV